jgi:hypothetical protein
MPHFMRALLVAAIVSGAACSVYDSELPYSNSAGDSSVTHDACVPQEEICNGKDDDCDGVTDEADAVALYCSKRVLNSAWVCESNYCLKVGSCNEGFYNCDGMPDNGCESSCPCDGCDDAGPTTAK